MGLHVVHAEEENEFVVMRTEGGDKVETFGLKSKYNRHFEPERPVVGFLVADLEEASEELLSEGVELVG